MCINYLAFIKSAGKPQNSRHIWKVDIHNIKLTVEFPNHNNLSSLDCNVTINKDNLYPLIFRKQSFSLVLSTVISLWIPVSWTILIAQSISLLAMVTPSPPYIFDNTLHKFVYNILLSEIKPGTAKKKLI